MLLFTVAVAEVLVKIGSINFYRVLLRRAGHKAENEARSAKEGHRDRDVRDRREYMAGPSCGSVVKGVGVWIAWKSSRRSVRLRDFRAQIAGADETCTWRL